MKGKLTTWLNVSFKKKKNERRMETVKHYISLMLSFLKSSFKFIFKRCDIVAKAAG